MFTGIIEALGTITEVKESQANRSFWIRSPITKELKVDQSVSHNGVCLTVESVVGDVHRVTAVNETLIKTNLGSWKAGDTINLERSVTFSGRLDGHIVQGHVDATALLSKKEDMKGSWELTFSYPEAFAALVIEKGSISVNGISLTVFGVTNNSFKVAIIPYTYEHTNLQHLSVSDKVNIEFDMMGKYVNRIMSLR